MRRSFVAATVIIPAAIILTGCGSAVTVLSDNFGSENHRTGQFDYFGFKNFIVSNANTGGSVDLIGVGFYDLYPGKGFYVDVCGTTSRCGILTTKQRFAPGTYEVTLELAGNGRTDARDATTVKFGGYSNAVYLSESETKTLKFTVALTSPAQLSVGDLGLINSEVGNILLSVKIVEAPKTSIWVWLGAGFLVLCVVYFGFTLLRLRRKDA